MSIARKEPHSQILRGITEMNELELNAIAEYVSITGQQEALKCHNLCRYATNGNLMLAKANSILCRHAKQSAAPCRYKQI